MYSCIAQVSKNNNSFIVDFQRKASVFSGQKKGVARQGLFFSGCKHALPPQWMTCDYNSGAWVYNHPLYNITRGRREDGRRIGVQLTWLLVTCGIFSMQVSDKVHMCDYATTDEWTCFSM